MTKENPTFDTFDLIFNAIVGYVYWSLVHGLGPMIWFYPLNELDITGYELFVLSCFSPILFLSQRMTNFLKSDRAIRILLIFMLIGCTSFHCATTLSRLMMLAMGVASACVLQGSLFWSNNEVNRITSFWGFTLGFMGLLASRVWYTSFTPLWNDYTTNSVLVTFFAVFISLKLFILHDSANDESSTVKSKQTNVKNSVSCTLASLACGALLFIIHALFGELSVISRYTVQGYPNTGPLPNPWGGLIGLALITGLILSMHTNLAEYGLWSLVGIAASMGLMFLPGWYGFLCGCFLAIYTASVWPTLFENMVSHEKPGKSLVIATATYLFGVFAMVWCTAYNFVPFGGELARERTFIIIGSMILLIAYSATRGCSAPPVLRFRLNLPDPKYYTTTPTVTPKSAKQLFGETVKKYLFIFTLFGLVGFQYRNQIRSARANFSSGETTAEQRKDFSALIWTFHFGYDNEGWPSMERAADVLRRSNADVITLLESDASKPYLGNNDIAMWLSEKLEMFVDFGPSTRDHTWGNLLLSKYPIVKSKHHLLPSPHGELAPAISATINISGSLVDFVATHMGNERDDLDRQLQADTLARLCNASENPLVFLGYMTSRPGSRDYNKLLNKGRMMDIDPTDKSRFCEYVMYRGLERLGYARISHGGLSDTELQLARWGIPAEPTKLQRRRKVTKEANAVPKWLRFGDAFGDYFDGHWWGPGHHYHMSTPKYFTVE